MKRIPKTPVEFDYDLWTTEDGKCMVRIKLTGEVTEVARDVMKILRAEEKKLRRSFTGEASEDGEDGNETVLSLDALPDDDVKSAAWLTDPHDFVKEVAFEQIEAEFIKGLTLREKEVYLFCIRDGYTQQEYAEFSGLSVSRVCKLMTAIRKKAKNFF